MFASSGLLLTRRRENVVARSARPASRPAPSRANNRPSSALSRSYAPARVNHIDLRIPRSRVHPRTRSAPADSSRAPPSPANGEKRIGEQELIRYTRVTFGRSRRRESPTPWKGNLGLRVCRYESTFSRRRRGNDRRGKRQTATPFRHPAPFVIFHGDLCRAFISRRILLRIRSSCVSLRLDNAYRRVALLSL